MRTSASAPAEPARVLLMEADPRHQRAVLPILKSLAEQVELDDGAGASWTGSYDLVVTGATLLEAAAQQAEAGPRSTRLLVLSEARSRRELSALFATKDLANLVARQQDHDLNDLVVTARKLLAGEIFGIEKYFAWGVRPLEFRLCASTDKAMLLESAERFCQGLGVSTRIANLFCTTCDELFTNAIYNAPRDEAGQPRHAHLSRTREVVLPEHEAVLVKLCSDGQRLGVSVADPFGALEPDKVRAYLSRCCRMGDDQVEQKAGGAGLGLYCVFQAASHFVVNVAPGRRTETIALFDIRGSYRAFAARGKSFNIFVGEP